MHSLAVNIHWGSRNKFLKSGGEVKEFGLLAGYETLHRNDFRLLQWIPLLISWPKAEKWLIALCSGCSPWLCLHLLPKAPHTCTASPFLGRCGSRSFGRFCVSTWVCLLGFRGDRPTGLERDCGVREKGKQLWGFQDGGAGSQEEKHGRLPRLGTHRALSEARACTQHRCWKWVGEGIKKKGGGAIKKRRRAGTSKGADWLDHYNPVFTQKLWSDC